MKCQICNDQESKYKCPACTTPYCSLACYKSHKDQCTPKPTQKLSKPEPKSTDTSGLGEQAQEDGVKSPYAALLKDEQIQYYLKFDSLRVHLVDIVSILNDPEVAKESTSEARRDVALIKLRQLRKGGAEQNELVELFATRVLELLEQQDV